VPRPASTPSAAAELPLSGAFGVGDVAEIEQAIQLAIAPAFLLTGIFSVINVLTGRLARLVDRERAVRAGTSTPLPGELRRLAQRAHCVYRAISASVLAAILLCSLIVIAFAGIFLGLKIAWLLGALLIAAMLAMIVALSLFLTEVRLAAHHLPLDHDV
jgi:hypothetical protein